MKEANPKLIGVFVIGAITLLVVAMVLFSSQDLFTPKRKFVAYFQQSVNGLNVGAPVRFRGIPVGEVIFIDGVYDPETGNMIPRLVFEFRPETLENAVVQDGEYTLLPLLLKNGLRASLKSASLLTGQLYVALDFHPDTIERRLSSGNDDYPEMPTIDSGFDEALAKLSDLPLEEVLSRAGGAFEAVENLLRQPGLQEAIATLPMLLTDADATVVDLKQYLDRDLVAVTEEARHTLASVRNSVQSLSTTLTDKSLVQVDATLNEMQVVLRLLHQRLEPGDPVMHELVLALREVGGAARALRELADTLEEHPESLLRGKATQ
jgi:paraquat-inducible protein B